MTWLLMLTLVAGGWLQAAQAQPAPDVRLHHLHYRVEDPAAAMNHAAAQLEGTRVLLQGLGVGVRFGDQYLLFDRIDHDLEARIDAHARTPGDAFTTAAAWLNARGVRAPASFAGRRLVTAAASAFLDHIAFVADDLAGVRESLRKAGAQTIRESADAAMYRTPDGLTIELLAPTDLEETFWCPMHPDVRSARAGTCPLCSMALVPIPPPRIGEYRMDVTLVPARGGAGISGLRLVIRDPETAAPVRAFATVHERPLHLFIVSRTLDYFAHVHPQQSGEGTFELQHDVPPGEFMLIADVLPHGGTAQTLQRAIVTPGFAGPLMAPVARPESGPLQQTVDGLRIRLEASDLQPRKSAALRFTVTDAATGVPVKDLEPFLGAPAHMLMVSADLTEAIHVHPEEPDDASSANPAIVTFDPLIPVAGVYKLWVQFQRKGHVITVPFVIDVADR